MKLKKKFKSFFGGIALTLTAFGFIFKYCTFLFYSVWWCVCKKWHYIELNKEISSCKIFNIMQKLLCTTLCHH